MTSDEAIDYLDRLQHEGGSGFRWPPLHSDLAEDLTNETPGKRTSPRLTKLAYVQKRHYVHRILSVLQRIRPSVDGLGQRAAFVESFHQVGARVEGFREVDWRNLIISNRYFGQVIRESGLTAADFTAELRAPDLFALAGHLSLSIRDVVSLLHDIKYSEAKAALLRFRWIVPPESSLGTRAGTTLSAVQESPILTHMGGTARSMWLGDRARLSVLGRAVI